MNRHIPLRAATLVALSTIVPFALSGSPVELGAGDQLAISNSFGFGGHNAVVAIASV